MGSMGRFDFRGLKEFQKSLEKLQESYDGFMEACARELAARLLAKVVERTPVGVPPKDIDDNRKTTVEVTGARGKKRKFLSREAEIYQRYWAHYKGGTLRRGWTIGEIRKEGGLYTIEVINAVEYASYVEYGHRQEPGRYVPALGKRLKNGWAKGKFIMTMSAQELERAAPEILEQKMKRFLEEHMR